MASTTWLLGILGAASVASAAGLPVRGGKEAEVISLKHHPRDIDLNAKAQHYVPLRSVARTDGGGAAAARNARRGERGGIAGRDPPYHQGNAGLYNAQDMYYITDITVGNVTVPVTIDTGSSDTWFVRSPFTCVDYYGRHVNVSPFPLPLPISNPFPSPPGN